MMTEEGFEQMVRALMARGMPRAKAEDYAWRIGDTPDVDGNGLWLIRNDHGVIIDAIQPLEEE